MEIIPFEPNYKDSFISLYKQVFYESLVYQEVFTDKEVEQILEENETYLLINNGELVGFTCGQNYVSKTDLDDIETRIVNESNKPIAFYISELATKNEYRGKGLGKMLIKFLLDKKIQEGKRFFLIHTRLNNPVRSLYESLGFSSVTNENGEIIESETTTTTINGVGIYKGLYLFKLYVL